MEEANYTMLEAHKKVHQSFIQRIEFFKERYNNGEDITKQLMNELQMWLINHIQHEDTDYTHSVKEMLETREITPSENSNNKWLKGLISKFFK
jgi:hemerythrin